MISTPSDPKKTVRSIGWRHRLKRLRLRIATGERATARRLGSLRRPAGAGRQPVRRHRLLFTIAGTTLTAAGKVRSVRQNPVPSGSVHADGNMASCSRAGHKISVLAIDAQVEPGQAATSCRPPPLRAGGTTLRCVGVANIGIGTCDIDTGA